MERQAIVAICRGSVVGAGLAYIVLIAAKAAGLLQPSATWIRVILVPGLLFATFAAVPFALYPLLKTGKSGLMVTLCVWSVILAFAAIYIVVFFHFWI